MNSARFTRARTISLEAGANYVLDYVIPIGCEFTVNELFMSCTKTVLCEILYSNDAGETWINPWDDEATHLLWVVIAGGIPAFASPENTVFYGDGENTKLRLRFTNLATELLNGFYLVKATEYYAEA